MLGNAENHVLPEIKTENFKLPSSFCLLRSNPSNGATEQFSLQFPNKKTLPDLASMAGGWRSQLSPSPASGKLTVAAGTAGSFAPRRGKRREARGRSGASGTVQFPADPERGVRGGDAGGPKASLALDRRRGCHGHGKGEFSAMIVLELRF